MSSKFHLSAPPRSGFATDEDVSSYKAAARDKQAEARTRNTSLRLSSLTLDELREELERRTEETQKLQEEVEDATRETLKTLGCTYSFPGQCCLSHDSSEDPPTVSAHQPRMTQPLVCSLDTLKQKVVEKDGSSYEKEALGNAINNHLQQLSDLQLNKISDQPGKDTFSPQRAIMNLQAELQDLQLEKDVVSDLRTEDLITILGQEMAMLTNKLSSSKDSGVRLCAKLDLLKKVTERQTSLHQCQISELQSTLSSYKDKVCCLEQKILETETHLFSSRRERERSLQQAKDLQSQLGQLKACCQRQQLDLREDAEILRGQLEVAREQLFKAGEEKTCPQFLLEQKAQEVKKFQKLLQEKEEELCFRQHQTQQHLVSLEDAQTRCRTLQTEQVNLQLKLKDRERMGSMQIESSTQMTQQHRHTIDSLQQENSLLLSQLNQHKLEIQQLRAELVQQKSNLASVESHRGQLQASVTELSQCVREETLKKEQVTTQLELQRVQLTSLTKEHEELQRLHSCKDDEHEGVVLKLQSQLSGAHDELDKIRRTLRTLQGVERNGLQVALDMQQEITARREQVDSLQGKIQHLEGEVEKLQQEKRHQKLESHRHLQEVTFIREEKRQLVGELKALRSKDQQLKERIDELEAILHKMSESFTNCQDFLQVREQEYFRLKLQHALDLKEIQGQNFSAPADLDSHIPSPLTAPPSSQIKKQQERSTCELRSIVRQLRGAISESHGPHTDENASGCGFHRRRSAPEKEHRTTSTEQVQFCSRLRRETCGSEPLFPTAEPNERLISKREGRCRSTPVTPVKYTSFPQILSLGRRSPVHTLLTSDPIS
uniref:Coiled-coil domain containing 158 n=1 Tax=Nothobranchius pienaari TaxID=704102 RepID=A0A1A8MH64_9TELE